MKYLVDTDWVIHHLKGNEEVRRKLKEFRCDGIGLSIISLAELYEGVYFSKDPIKDQKDLELLISQFSLLQIDKEICKIFGKERGKLRQQIKKQKKSTDDIDNFDLLIASTALYYKLTLLTNNQKHFEKVEGLKIISI